MQKAAALLAIVGTLLAVGIGLTAYSSMIVLEDFAQNIQNIGEGATLEISTDLDPMVNDEGVYAVQIMQFRDGMISASVIDPFGSQIISKVIETDSYEEKFKITSKGNYKLIIENRGENSDVVGGIGHVPDKFKVAIAYASASLLIAGLIGIGIVGIYAIKNRRRN